MAQWRCWLQQVWASEAIAAAVEVASPVLARRVGEVCAGHEQRARQVRRAVVSVVRYLLRMTSRATPFGLFAGVAPVRFGPELRLRYGEEHHAVARVDTEWLVGAITRLERCPELRRRLPVVLNNLAFVRDGRLVVGCRQQPAGSGRTEPAEVSVRHTKAVATVIQAAESPIRVGDLADKLTADFPETLQSVIERMLAELVAQRILVTSLRPPLTATDPLGHVVEELAAVGADAVPRVAELFHDLRDIHLDLSGHNRASSSTERRERRTSAAQRMAAIFATERPVTVDLRVDCALVLPHAVAREAEAAAAALARLSPYPVGVPAWQDYHHARFLERYGIGALVSLSEVLHADAGLGFPAGYRDARLKPPPAPGLSERDVALLALAQKAAMDHSVEIVLDDRAVADLAVEDVGTARVQPHTELRFRVHASTPGALDRGEFELAVAGVSRAAGTTTGRFLDLLDSGDRERMFGAYAQLPTVSEDAIPVQVSCPPLYPRAENVARSPAVLPHLVSVAEHHTPGASVIPLDDLAVSGDAQRLYLMSLSRRRPVEPVVFSAVEFTNAAHPLLRFLCEISTARSAACAPFSWGAASRLPFLPRVHHRTTPTAMGTPACPTASPPPWRCCPSQLRRGIAVDGHTDAISRICAWLDTWQQEHSCGPWWPGIITVDDVHKEHVQQSSPQRPSWCYGTPGLARAHQLAGLATGDTARQRTAETALLGCVRDPEQLARIVDSGLCHGMAGVFQTAWRMAADAHTPDIKAELPRLSARLLTQLRSSPEDTEFLDGQAGIALALHTAGTHTAPLAHWDACLLLT